MPSTSGSGVNLGAPVMSSRCARTLPTAPLISTHVNVAPLVSADYTNDTHSGTVDALSTMVIDGRMVKVLIWYDNEYGYVFRMAELAALVAQ